MIVTLPSPFCVAPTLAVSTPKKANRDQFVPSVTFGPKVCVLYPTAAAGDGTLRTGEGETRLFITPGYRFRAADVMLTNFHLPRSTLFMLVCAFCGLETMQRAYAHAIETGYRFYSYGDACLLFRAS